jgi:hypothetical protein
MMLRGIIMRVEIPSLPCWEIVQPKYAGVDHFDDDGHWHMLELQGVVVSTLGAFLDGLHVAFSFCWDVLVSRYYV